MMKCMIRLVNVAAFSTLVLLAPTLMAQPAFPTLDSPEATHALVTADSCQWWTETTGLSPGENTEDGPHRQNALIGPLTAYADARASAFGMEIWADASAHDELWLWTATATTSAIGSGHITLKIIPRCTAPSPFIRLDWKPKFKLRAQVIADTADAIATGSMTGSCYELGVNVNIYGAARRATDSALASVGIAIPGVIGLTIPVLFGSGIGAEELACVTYALRTGHIQAATCTFTGGVSCSVTADDDVWLGKAACLAKCFESKAGIDLDGVCQACGAHSYITYGWY